jgi:phthiocerol/phenolphthiocerol synthesis type-I polyketide synthase E
MLESLGALWSASVAVDWAGFHAFERRTRVGLPTYPFEEVRCYVPPLPWNRRVQGTEASRLGRSPTEAPTASAPQAGYAPDSGMSVGRSPAIPTGDAAPGDSDLTFVLREQLDLGERQLKLLSAGSPFSGPV